MERAAKWLEGAEPLSMEDRSMQLLGLAWAGHKPPRDRVEQLVFRQRADGGWAETDHLQSDAALAFQPYFQSGFPHDHDQGISQAGAAMTVIALSFAAE